MLRYWAVCLIAVLVVTEVPAQSSREPLLVPYSKVRDVSSQVVSGYDLETGRQLTLGARPRFTQVSFFNSIGAPCGDPNGPLNLAYFDGAGEPICSCPFDPNEIASNAVLALGDEGCSAITTFPELGIVDPLDVVFDNYKVDTTRDGCDPNDRRYLDFVVLHFWYEPDFGPNPPLDPYILSLRIGFLEDRDLNGNGILDSDLTILLRLMFQPDDPGGLFQATFAVQDLMYQVWGRGLIMVDFDERLIDFATFQTLPQLACNVGVPIAGGIPDRPGCDTPQDWVTLGSVETPQDYWLLANDTQGDSPGPPWDPNVPNDPAADGDPSSLSYVDILNSGLLVDADPGTAHGIPFIVGLYGDTCLCGPACEVVGGTDADFDDDCDVDLADLAVVLRWYGEGFDFPANVVGDTNFDQKVDLTDLANCLNLFGASCPP